ncbi:MAG: GerMN domain-containing protein [Selenomonadaceae bacterium]|nr:GerMN domain-containing protein [Selenomonadaceae bacterium]
MVRKIFILALFAFTLLIFGCTQQTPKPVETHTQSTTTETSAQTRDTSAKVENPIIPLDAPLPPPSNEPAPPPQPVTTDTAPSTPRERNIDIKVYFPDEAGINLVAVKRRIRITSENQKYEDAVKIIMANPKEMELTSIFPRGAKLNKITLENGTAYVDFSETLQRYFVGGSTGEELLVTSLVDTLTEFPEVKRVQILIDGEEIETLAGHMDLSEPLTRNGSTL